MTLTEQTLAFLALTGWLYIAADVAIWSYYRVWMRRRGHRTHGWLGRRSGQYGGQR